MATLDQNIVERIESAIRRNKEKAELGNVGMEKGIELIREVGAVLLDVRPPAKVNGENAEEANIPDAYYTPYTEFADYLDILPQDKTTPILVACLKGWFANRVMGYLEALGYENVYVLGANIEDLIAAHKAHTK
ncbi:rhodanese-like domain-containing protein [Hydrogenimonas urashimensis]|uniref:rhodanese-like domain-containing protein n=1 Tax=Hydrogenimonas urashimensis TaxID=2740515 RepID=UPI0019154EDF|nr:rhodanese-like domain-containing protein [Hydrogenimonas urashimensis]